MSQTASRSAGASGRSSSRSVAMGSAGRNMRRIYPSGMTRTGGRLCTFPPAPQPLRVPVPDSHTHLDITLSEGGGGGPRTVKEAIESVAGRDRVRAVGETGLDFFRTPEPGRPTQEASFRAHIAIAKRHGKALVIHDRDAHAEILRVLDEEGAPDAVVMHCFSGDAAFAIECAKRGYVLSFAGTVTFASAGALREAARVTPLDQILVETDAPYLTPMPYRGRPNASYLIPLTVRALAETKGVEVDELCAAISATGERIFGPW